MTIMANIEKSAARRSIRFTTCALLLVFSAFAGSFTAIPAFSAVQPNQEVSPKQLQELKRAISRLNASINKAEGKKSDLQTALQTSEQQINRITREIHQVESRLKKSQARLKALQDRKRGLERRLRTQQVYLKKQIVTAYSLGRQPAIKVLLNLEDPQKMDRTLAYFDYFNKARAEQIKNHQTTIDELRDTRAAIDRENTTLKKSRNQLEASKVAVKKSQLSRRRTLAKLNSSIKNKSLALDKLRSDQNRLERLLKEVEKAIATLQLPEDSRPFSQLKSKLPWPTRGKVTEYYGSRLAGGKLRRNGVVIETRNPIPVNAVHYGRVVFSDWVLGFGLMTIIDHGGGYMSLYGHNKSLLKEAGDWVHSGEVIAYSGSSGGQPETGLYFEIRKNGKPRNPLTWLQRK